MPKKPLLEGIATLVGFIIGAGILGIPYVVAKAGFITGIINIIVIGILLLLLHLYLGEIVLRTKGNHQLTGYASIYLGKKGKLLMTISLLFGYYGALIAYTLKEGEFLNAILSPIFGGSSLFYSILFFAICSVIVYKGLKVVEESELFMVFFLLITIIVIFVLAFSSINPENLTGFNAKSIFIPYGVVFFAYLGLGAIPEVREEMAQNKKNIKKAILIGSLIPIIVYLLFALVVVGITGRATTEDAILGLTSIFGYKMFIFGILFGVLAMATSFVAIGLALKEMYCFDFKCKETLSSCLACLVPLILTLIIISAKIHNSFYKVLNITGAFDGSLSGILIVLMVWQAKKFGQRKPEYSMHINKFTGLLFMLLFLAGTIYTVLELAGKI